MKLELILNVERTISNSYLTGRLQGAGDPSIDGAAIRRLSPETPSVWGETFVAKTSLGRVIRPPAAQSAIWIPAGSLQAAAKPRPSTAQTV